MKFGNQTVQHISRPINSWNLCQIGIKLGAKHVIYHELANLM